MSYILDALRRSQAERERGQVPGLHAQTLPADVPPPVRRPAAGWWLGLGLGVGACAALAVWWLRPAPVVVAVAPAAPAAAPAPAAALPQVVSVAPAPAPAPVTAPVPAPAAVGSPAVSPVAGPAPPPVPTPTPTPRALPLAELSAEQRRDLPPLAMGGSIWSENAQSRFVIVNGQVVREGEAAAPGVTVERIGQKAVVLRWRELRVELPL